MTQRARVVKSHELQKVVSCQRVLVTKRYEIPKELRMVLVKARSREGSINERLCNVWVDDARDELVIVYETVKKLCIGSHVSK
ncbi:hypothetical protein YC2023_108197 [Brassica napus]